MSDRVLLVDDDRALLRALSIGLSARGYDVVTAATGQDGVVLVTQVLANLVTNAAQHSPEGSTITVAARLEGSHVVIEVRDEGPGVPEWDRERIFHLLDRRAGSGRSGLGLAISAAFVEAHGGRLSVGDAPGGGAAFRFNLPVSALEEALR